MAGEHGQGDEGKEDTGGQGAQSGRLPSARSAWFVVGLFVAGAIALISAGALVLKMGARDRQGDTSSPVQPTVDGERRRE